jgi:hypothetical protein
MVWSVGCRVQAVGSCAHQIVRKAEHERRDACEGRQKPQPGTQASILGPKPSILNAPRDLGYGRIVEA